MSVERWTFRRGDRVAHEDGELGTVTATATGAAGGGAFVEWDDGCDDGDHIWTKPDIHKVETGRRREC